MINDVVGKLVADKYLIEELISESESGDLYRGRHEVLDKPVTVRILSPALAIDARWVKRFVDEARAASAVTHQNILNLTDFGTDARGTSYAVFEPAEGQTLRDIVDNGPAMDEKRALDLTRQIAMALGSAHNKKVVHGALDPKHVFVNEAVGSDSVKVYGFGSDPMNVARDADPRYLSPEQCTAFPAADGRSDIFALGVMLYEMLSGGVAPFEGATPADVLRKQNTEPPAPLSAFRRDLHPEIEPIIISAIAADPERRYQTVEAFAEDLDTLAGRVGVATPAAAVAPGRNIWQAAFIVFAGIVLLAGVFIYATSVRSTDPTTQLQADVGSLPVQPIGPATGAQEESLAKLPAMTDAEIMATANMELPPGALPGGDGFNAWANGGVPPAGAPLSPYVPPGGQVYTIDPNGGSQFMPPDGGVILVPVPANTEPAAKPSPTPKTGAPAANTVPQATPAAAATPKPLATPPKKEKPAANTPGKTKTPSAANPATEGQPKGS